MKIVSGVSILFLKILFYTSCYSQVVPSDSTNINIERLELYDYSRNRSIPVALYLPDTLTIKQPLVVFSHGYSENKGTPYLNYSYLNIFLAQHGYLVASIQHELPSDDPLPLSGDLRETRRPNWESGVQNILFVVKELKSRLPNVDDKRYSLIGHSNGGDLSMLLASEYPQRIRKSISLDNRRMPLPLIDSLKIYTLRSNDLPADKGVIPALKQQSKHGITIIFLPDTRHAEMCDDTATEEQKKEIREYVLKFLEEKKTPNR